MATSRKRKTNASSKSNKAKNTAVKKKATPKKKTAAKKAPARKKATKKTTKSPTSTKRVRKSSTPQKKKVMKPKNKSWFSVLTFSTVALVVATVGFLGSNPDILEDLQANIMAQIEEMSGEESIETTAATTPEGILISWKEDGENEAKLKDIFQTVFPETDLMEINYSSPEGQELVEELGTTEIPNIYFEQSAFAEEALSEVVRDLFELNNGYYGLNVSLVNPSYQMRIGGPLSRDNAIVVGDETAPLDLTIYSDPKCQHCRVLEKNTMESFGLLAQEGIAQLHFIELPQSRESQFHATALHCVGRLNQEGYMAFRQRLFERANLSNAYSKRELERMDINYDEDCNEQELLQTFRSRAAAATTDGITGVPAVYIARSGEEEAIRITGSKDFSEYETVFDQLMGTEQSEETGQ